MTEVEQKEVMLPREGSLRFGGLTFSVRVLERGKEPLEIPEKLYTKWLDYDKICMSPMLRFRHSGDYLVVDAKNHRKRLKEYFIEEKIPKEIRDRVPCLADGSKILWVVGHRISEDCKVSEDTGKILEIKVSGGRMDE